MARRLRRRRSASRPGGPICGAGGSCSGPLTRPTSCRAATSSTARSVLHALARGARHLDRSADKAPPGPAADHRLERRDRRRPGRPGRAGAARARARPASPARSTPRCTTMAAWSAARRPSSSLWSSCSPSCAPSISPRAATCRNGSARRWPASAAALLAATLGDEALSSWQGGNMVEPAPDRSPRSKARASTSGRCARRAAGAISGSQAKTTVLVFDAAPPPPTRALRRRLRLDPRLRAERRPAPAGRQLRRRRRIAGGAAGRARPGAAHHRRPFDADPRRPQLDRDPRRRHARQGRRRGRAVARRDRAGSLRVEASHDGYARRFGLIHQRRLTLAPTAASCAARTGSTPRRAAGAAARRSPFAVRFHLAPGGRGGDHRRRPGRAAAGARRRRLAVPLPRRPARDRGQPLDRRRRPAARHAAARHRRRHPARRHHHRLGIQAGALTARCG